MLDGNSIRPDRVDRRPASIRELGTVPEYVIAGAHASQQPVPVDPSRTLIWAEQAGPRHLVSIGYDCTFRASSTIYRLPTGYLWRPSANVY